MRTSMEQGFFLGVYSMTTYVLWGTKQGAKLWDESVITETRDWNHLQRGRKWAKDRGFTNLRVMIHPDGDKPDFKSTIKV